MYLDYFQLTKPPFSLTPNTAFYCDLPNHQAALNVLLFSLNSGEGFIKIIGEVGSGKTLLCRKLLNALGDNCITAYIPNPDLNSNGLRKALMNELGIESAQHDDQTTILALLNEKLTTLHAEGKQVVVIVDEAQALPDQSLETLRLLSNLETESEKLLQIVLFAQPELTFRLKQHKLRQLNQRITFSYYLNPLAPTDLDAYLCHRLTIAGYTKGSLFDAKAQKMLYKASQGIPRIINILCHKALLAAYGQGQRRVGRKAMLRAIKDSQDLTLKKPIDNNTILAMTTWVAVAAALGVSFMHYFHFIK
jgi:MSHA biogenesis protein MshM